MFTSKKFLIAIQHHEDRRQRHLEDRQLNQARSQPDTVNRPVRTARTIVHHYNEHLRCGQVEVGVLGTQGKKKKGSQWRKEDTPLLISLPNDSKFLGKTDKKSQKK